MQTKNCSHPTQGDADATILRQLQLQTAQHIVHCHLLTSSPSMHIHRVLSGTYLQYGPMSQTQIPPPIFWPDVPTNFSRLSFPPPDLLGPRWTDAKLLLDPSSVSFHFFLIILISTGDTRHWSQFLQSRLSMIYIPTSWWFADVFFW